LDAVGVKCLIQVSTLWNF